MKAFPVKAYKMMNRVNFRRSERIKKYIIRGIYIHHRFIELSQVKLNYY